MFVALEIRREAKSSLLSRVRGLLTSTKAWVEPRECCGVPYAALCVQPGRGELDWKEIAWLARDYSRWVLLPENVTLPGETALRAYDTARFDRELLLHTACEIITRTRMPMYRRMLGILDDDGDFANLLYPLLKHYTSVKVVTANRERYAFAAEQMMEELGAPVLIGDSLSFLSDCVLVLSPKDYSSGENIRLPCPVLAGGSFSLPRRPELLSNLQAGLPAIAEVPAGIAPHLFAGALYELCGMEQASLVASSLLYNHRISSVSEAVTVVLRAAGMQGMQVNTGH